MSLQTDFQHDGIAEELYAYQDLDTRRLLHSAKRRLREYLASMTLDEILDRLWRQTPGLKDEL